MNKYMTGTAGAVLAISLLAGCENPLVDHQGESKTSPGEVKVSDKEQLQAKKPEEVILMAMTKLDTPLKKKGPSKIFLPAKKYLSAVTESDKSHYKIKLYLTDSAVKINDTKLKNGAGTKILTFSGEKADKAAKEAETLEKIPSIVKGDVKLGKDFKAKREEESGKLHYKFKKSAWLIDVIGAKDNDDKIKKHAKEIAEYLSSHKLVSPKSPGKIEVDTTKKVPATTIFWRDDDTIYKVETTEKKPVDAIEIANSFKVY